MKNRQFILGLLLYFWVGVIGIALSRAIDEKQYIIIAIHFISILFLAYKGYKLIKKTI